MDHSSEQLLDVMAPCSLLCYSCPAFARGIVCELSEKLENYFKGFYDFLAECLPEKYKPKAEEFKSFEERLREYAKPGCNGCRDDRNPECSVNGCFILECTREHGVDYCGECDAFPCRKVDTIFSNPAIHHRWLRGNMRIQQAGAAQFFEEEKGKSHYIDFASNDSR